MRRSLAFAFTAALAFAIGIVVERDWLSTAAEEPLPPPPPSQSRQRLWSRLEALPRSDPVECPQRATVVFVAGQSNAANTVGQRSRAVGKVFWRHDGRCYPALDPLPGSEAVFGSVWPAVGDELVDSGLSESVVFVGAAMGGTTIAQWDDTQGLGGYLRERLAREPRIDYVLWHQGESDRSTPGPEYASRLGRVLAAIRSLTPAPILVAQTSVCGRGEPVEAIRNAQRAAADAGQRIFAGPDTDQFTAFADRYDDCHFSPAGAAKVSRAWVASIAATRRSR